VQWRSLLARCGHLVPDLRCCSTPIFLQGQLDEANDKVARLTETLAQRDEELACLKRQVSC